MRVAIAALSFSALGAPLASAGVFDTEPAKGGFYLSGFGGINFGQDADFDGVQDPAAGVPGLAGGPALVNVDFGSARAPLAARLAPNCRSNFLASFTHAWRSKDRLSARM
ncbi:MAG: hypothetical protein AAFU58_00625 [Pseudomonadota bacterium]